MLKTRIHRYCILVHPLVWMLPYEVLSEGSILEELGTTKPLGQGSKVLQVLHVRTLSA